MDIIDTLLLWFGGFIGPPGEFIHAPFFSIHITHERVTAGKSNDTFRHACLAAIHGSCVFFSPLCWYFSLYAGRHHDRVVGY